MHTTYKLDSYTETLSSYRRLLEANPGSALVISSDCVALLHDGHLCAAILNAQPHGFSVGVIFEFCESGWDRENDCWENAGSPSETTSCIRHPRFISIESGQLL
ncbi:hypothetical protein ACCD10_20295 [Pseudomonas sp. Pseusp122]|uniref:hypothetical protein n=1 Tax=unclassified Pseudomonas TaxID=196821 RepID=UPI0039A44919